MRMGWCGMSLFGKTPLPIEDLRHIAMIHLYRNKTIESYTTIYDRFFDQRVTVILPHKFTLSLVSDTFHTV